MDLPFPLGSNLTNLVGRVTATPSSPSKFRGKSGKGKWRLVVRWDESRGRTPTARPPPLERKAQQLNAPLSPSRLSSPPPSLSSPPIITTILPFTTPPHPLSSIIFRLSRTLPE
ncbi:hypothetical protein BO99DRAFT_177211 [Aspergillus violaceofuscus CBS 115571]|uniref:Uncharacterized protein n=1 Tax=Aspergillus violaceofuscus (strain CBS 115571) TaxID=1450538 RepID=A0A2V5H220_ASPV1|nr:hypothetical protein BO99DRAFT_177211 [Aspergillus violaceofuscus CBS 115571]